MCSVCNRQKIRSIWKYVALGYGRDFEWFFVGGDDLFVIPSNLRAYLRSPEVLAATEGGRKPLFIGRRFQQPGGQFFNSGGAGYGLNRAALKLLVDHLDDGRCMPHQKVFAEDVNVAHCLGLFGVKPHDTRDHGGAGGGEMDLPERFHPFTPAQHLSWRPPRKKKADGSSSDWYENYNKPWGLGLGEACCSKDSVSFHYVKPALMPKLSALLWDCRDQRR